MIGRDLIVIAGGQGTRISAHFPGLPKLLLPVAGKTVFEHLICEIPFARLFLSLGFRSEKVVSFLDDHKINGEYSIESKPLGSFGGLKSTVVKFRESLSQDIIVILGDVFVSDLMTDIRNIHSDCNSVLYSKNDHPFDSDRVIVEANGCVTGLIPKTSSFTSEFINTTVSGLYVFRKKDILESPLSEGDIGMDFLPTLIEKGDVQAVRLTGVMKDVGSIERLNKIDRLYSMGAFADGVAIRTKRAAFFDLDGTIIWDRGSKLRSELQHIELIQGISEVIKLCNINLIPVIIVSNQGDLAKGFKTKAELYEDFLQLEYILAQSGIWVDDFFYCPHHPDKGFQGEVEELKVICDCRKPRVGLFDQAHKKWNINARKSVMFGNTPSDKAFSDNVGMGHYFSIDQKSFPYQHDYQKRIKQYLSDLTR
jgi:histidinol-phosphate phosphatase family protein